MKQPVRVGIVGGSGYGGGELLKILLAHPRAEVRLVTAGRNAGRRVDQVHPNLRGITELEFESFNAEYDFAALDLLFLALPHGESPEVVRRLPRDLRLIDLAGDFRLRDAGDFRRFYGRELPPGELLSGFVYGLADLHPDRIRQARRVANPGCFATAVTLALYPLVAARVLEGRPAADCKTGSSGSGAQAKDTTHHPRRSNSFYAYKPFSHQHLPEIRQALRRADPEWGGGLVLQTHSAPLVRGIFATVFATLRHPLKNEEVRELYQRQYGGSRFLRLVEGSPDVNWVKNSNFADIGWAVEGRQLIAFCAIDNLVKGAAGQAVQNMNLMFGFPEDAGLDFVGSHP